MEGAVWGSEHDCANSSFEGLTEGVAGWAAEEAHEVVVVEREGAAFAECFLLALGQEFLLGLVQIPCC